MPQPVAAPVAYVAPKFEPDYDDMICLLITLKDCLGKMRTTRINTRAMAAIDLALKGKA